jgi:hypothetical protein
MEIFVQVYREIVIFKTLKFSIKQINVEQIGISGAIKRWNQN